MIKSELVSRSPLRIFERSAHGGVGKGNIGIIASCKGVGKTACLVHIATDQLLLGKQVIHCSFAQSTEHIVLWYENIFNELARRNNLDGAHEVHDDIIRNRFILNFKQDEIHFDHLRESIRAIVDNAHFEVNVLVIDGFDFQKSNPAELQAFRQFAQDAGLEIWFSASLSSDDVLFDRQGIPRLLLPFMSAVAIVIYLEPRGGEYIHLQLVKDHDAVVVSDLHLKLDPELLLIAQE